MSDNTAIEELHAKLSGKPGSIAWPMLEAVALDTGGHAKSPQPGNTWDANVFAVELFGVSAWDTDRDRCVAIWLAAAARILDRTEALATSTAAILGNARYSVEAMRTHCDTVISLSDNAQHIFAARQIKIAIDQDARAEGGTQGAAA